MEAPPVKGLLEVTTLELLQLNTKRRGLQQPAMPIVEEGLFLKASTLFQSGKVFNSTRCLMSQAPNMSL